METRKEGPTGHSSTQTASSIRYERPTHRPPTPEGAASTKALEEIEAPDSRTDAKTRWWATRFGLEVDARYHAAMEAWHDGLYGVTMVIATFGASSAVAAVAAISTTLGVIIALIAALSGGIAIAFRPARRASFHSDLKRRSLDLLAKMQRHGDTEDETTVRDFEALKTLLDADAPHMRPIVWKRCHNLQVMVDQSGTPIPITRLEALFAYFILWDKASRGMPPANPPPAPSKKSGQEPPDDHEQPST